MDAVPFAFVERVLLSLDHKNKAENLDNALWSRIAMRLSSRKVYIATVFKDESDFCCNFREVSTLAYVSFDEIKASNDSCFTGMWTTSATTRNLTPTMKFHSFEANLLPFLLSRLVPTAHLSIEEPSAIAEMLLTRLLERRAQNCLQSVHLVYCGQLSLDFLQNLTNENVFLNNVSLNGDYWPNEILINVRQLLLRKEILLQISSPTVDIEFVSGIVDYWTSNRGFNRTFFFRPNFDFSTFACFMAQDNSLRYSLVIPEVNAVLTAYQYPQHLMSIKIGYE